MTLTEFFDCSELEDVENEEIAKVQNQMWRAYCYYKLGKYLEAIDVYNEVLRMRNLPEKLEMMVPVFKAICQLKLDNEGNSEGKKDKEGLEAMNKVRKLLEDFTATGLSQDMQGLCNRLLLDYACSGGKEQDLVKYHQNLTDSLEDQLALAAIHYKRNHFQEATDVYKRLLLDNRDHVALNVYIAMCYYKLDYYDVSLEILASYLQAFPESVLAVNLKACNHFKLYNGKSAETELKAVLASSQKSNNPNVGNTNSLRIDVLDGSFQVCGDNITSKHLDIIQHNLVVFSEGRNALRIFPSLVDKLPEAKMNLAIYYLKNQRNIEAFRLLEDMSPSTPQEYVLKGIVHARLGLGQTGENLTPQKDNSRRQQKEVKTTKREHLRLAQQYFQLVGASASECDTIPGRQCMASCFYLLKQFEDVNTYLSSIKAYLYNDDDFNYNYGVSLAKTGNYADAEEHLQQVENLQYKQEYTFLASLARCFIFNKKPRQAWELYLKMNSDHSVNSQVEPSSKRLVFNLLQVIANDCYRVCEFYYAAKAFDVLETLDRDLEHWEGKRGAIAGVFQLVIAGKMDKSILTEMLSLLKHTSNPQVEYFMRTITNYLEN